jgi:hypothetical protein
MILWTARGAGARLASLRAKATARETGGGVKLEERLHGVLAFVDETGRVWAQCAPSSPGVDDYVIEGPLSGFVCEPDCFTPESEQAFRTWLDDHMFDDTLFYVKEREIALDFAERIATAAQRILKDRG